MFAEVPESIEQGWEAAVVLVPGVRSSSFQTHSFSPRSWAAVQPLETLLVVQGPNAAPKQICFRQLA